MPEVINYNPPEKKGLSKEELEKLLAKWQEKLKMDGWSIDLKIVDFERKDFRQSGDFKADPEEKRATILMTWNPWRGDEEYTLLHELIHVLLWDMDSHAEKLIFSNKNYDKEEYGWYLEKVEQTVHTLTFILLGRKDKEYNYQD